MSQEKLIKLIENVDKALKKSSNTNAWESYVPISSFENTHYVYLTNTFDEPNYYNELCHMLYNANDYEEFILVINSPGGILDSVFMIIDAIKNTKANVICKLAGTVASAGTILALSCDELMISSNLTFMVHNYSSGFQGKGHEMKARQNFIDRELNKSFKEFYSGFLSDEEIEDVIDGKDIWLNESEVLDRWNNKKSVNNIK